MAWHSHGWSFGPSCRSGTSTAADTVGPGITSYDYAIRIDGPSSGELFLRRVELPVPFFCNDLALDAFGNVYVSDSPGDAVMRIRPWSLWVAGESAEVFARDARLKGKPINSGLPVGISGIAVSPDNRHLLVARGQPAQLFRIRLSDPGDVRAVELGEDFGLLPVSDPPRSFNPDGIVFVGRRLYVVFAAGVQELSFEDGRRLATVDTIVDVPFGLSTATRAHGGLYVIDSEIHALAGAAGVPIELPHRIVRVPQCGDHALGRFRDCRPAPGRRIDSERPIRVGGRCGGVHGR